MGVILRIGLLELWLDILVILPVISQFFLYSNQVFFDAIFKIFFARNEIFFDAEFEFLFVGKKYSSRQHKISLIFFSHQPDGCNKNF